MKRSSMLVAVALGAALVLAGTAGAFAADSSSGSSKGTSASAAKSDPVAAARNVINENFQDAVAKAKTEFDAAMKLAVTAEAKATALAARRFSVSSAIAARQNAITALEKEIANSTAGKSGKRGRR